MRRRHTSPELFPIPYAFVVQLAAETTLDATGLTGRVEHIASGQAVRFQSVEALVAFMIARLQESQRGSATDAAEESPAH